MKSETYIPTINKISGNSNSMILDLNFGDRDRFRDKEGNIVETYKLVEYKFKTS